MLALLAQGVFVAVSSLAFWRIDHEDFAHPSLATIMALGNFCGRVVIMSHLVLLLRASPGSPRFKFVQFCIPWVDILSAMNLRKARQSLS